MGVKLPLKRHKISKRNYENVNVEKGNLGQINTNTQRKDYLAFQLPLINQYKFKAKKYKSQANKKRRFSICLLIN